MYPTRRSGGQNTDNDGGWLVLDLGHDMMNPCRTACEPHDVDDRRDEDNNNRVRILGRIHPGSARNRRSRGWSNDNDSRSKGLLGDIIIKNSRNNKNTVRQQHRQDQLLYRILVHPMMAALILLSVLGGGSSPGGAVHGLLPIQRYQHHLAPSTTAPVVPGVLEQQRRSHPPFFAIAQAPVEVEGGATTRYSRRRGRRRRPTTTTSLRVCTDGADDYSAYYFDDDDDENRNDEDLDEMRRSPSSSKTKKNGGNDLGAFDPYEKIQTDREKMNVGDPQLKVQDKQQSVTSILRELAAIRQQGPQKYCILGTRHCSFLHQQIIELLAYALVLSGNHVYTSGAGGTHAATIRGALRAERQDLLTVVLPQSMVKQTSDSQSLLVKVDDIIEMPQNDDMPLDIASRICNSYLLSQTDQLISFAFHESSTVIEATKEAKKLDLIVTVLYLD